MLGTQIIDNAWGTLVLVLVNAETKTNKNILFAARKVGHSFSKVFEKRGVGCFEPAVLLGYGFIGVMLGNAVCIGTRIS